ncbi:MAG: prepilin-type N-terminal cleavage/methylation domain-containing protein [Desulfotalea sp.]
MYQKSFERHNQNGFTIVEMMVALVLSALIIVAIYSAYTIQQKTHTAQAQVVVMQQNARALLDIMVREIRMAGYDDSTLGVAGAEIYIADSSSIAFSADLNEDGDTTDAGENIAFSLYDNNGVSTQGRLTSAAVIPAALVGLQPIAENIERLEFLYTLDNGNRVLNPTAGQLDNIVAVQISVLAVSAQRDANFTLDAPASGVLYKPASASLTANVGSSDTCTVAATANCVSQEDWTPQAGIGIRDGLRRRYFTTLVNCRNLRF